MNGVLTTCILVKGVLEYALAEVGVLSMEHVLATQDTSAPSVVPLVAIEVQKSKSAVAVLQSLETL